MGPEVPLGGLCLVLKSECSTLPAQQLAANFVGRPGQPLIWLSGDAFTPKLLMGSSWLRTSQASVAEGTMSMNFRLLAPRTAKLTTPSVFANMVWSLPTPEFRPA